MKNAFVAFISQKLKQEFEKLEKGKFDWWKYNLPNAWRLMYIIEADEIRILSIILEWLNHKEYEKRFNY